MGDELIKNKSLVELESMEQAVLTVTPRGNSNPATPGRGLGLTGGTSSGTSPKTVIEAELEMYEKARARSGSK